MKLTNKVLDSLVINEASKGWDNYIEGLADVFEDVADKDTIFDAVENSLDDIVDIAIKDLKKLKVKISN